MRYYFNVQKCNPSKKREDIARIRVTDHSSLGFVDSLFFEMLFYGEGFSKLPRLRNLSKPNYPCNPTDPNKRTTRNANIHSICHLLYRNGTIRTGYFK